MYARQRNTDDTIPKGLVISQNPAAGTELKKGDKVKVVISKGKEAIPPKSSGKGNYRLHMSLKLRRRMK